MHIFTLRIPLVLASASPRRKAFLDDLGLPFTAIAPIGAEPAPLNGEAPEPYAIRAASAKAAALMAAVSDGAVFFQSTLPASFLILAADTVVAINKRILGKPKDQEEALEYLSLLRGKTHEVITGCCLLTEEKQETFAVRSRVTMWDCPDTMLAAYAASEEPLDKAGAYAVQGAGAFLVESIEGSWSNVVGLPLAEVIQALLRMGALSL